LRSHSSVTDHQAYPPSPSCRIDWHQLRTSQPTFSSPPSLSDNLLLTKLSSEPTSISDIRKPSILNADIQVPSRIESSCDWKGYPSSESKVVRTLILQDASAVLSSNPDLFCSFSLIIASNLVPAVESQLADTLWKGASKGHKPIF
jgi:hypothetical protein